MAASTVHEVTIMITVIDHHLSTYLASIILIIKYLDLLLIKTFQSTIAC